MRALALVLGLLSCGGDARAQGVLSIDITTTKGEDYETAIAIAQSAGAQATSLSLAWDEMEPRRRYDPDTDWPAIANAFYPPLDLALSLTFSVIDTTTDRRPSDLLDTPWNSATTKARFAAHSAEVLSRMGDVDIPVIAVGNEIDGLLSDPADIAAYAEFLTAAKTAIHADRAGTVVGAKITFGGLSAQPGLWSPVLAVSDAVLITYYPLQADFTLRPASEIAGDLDRMIALSGGKPVYILESGYPSGGCGVPVSGQADFFATLLTEWSARQTQVPLLSLTWLTDLPADEARAYATYYGLGDNDCFGRFLATLGLRDETGAAKPALDALIARSAGGG